MLNSGKQLLRPACPGPACLGPACLRQTRLLALLMACVLVARGASAQLSGPATPDKVSTRVTIDQRLGEHVDLSVPFKDETGKDVKLGDYFGQKPVVLALVYYQCPMLCTMTLNGMVSSFRPLKHDAGKDFEVVVISFDHREAPELAAAKKKAYVESYGRPGVESGWHFLTGTPESIKKVTDAVGFNYYYDTRTAQFAHSSGIQVLTPTGKLSRYFYGLEYSTKDLGLSLVEASDNKIGTLAERLTLLCYQYDPTTGKYGLAIMRTLRVMAVLTMLGIVGLWVTFARRGRTEAAVAGADPAMGTPRAETPRAETPGTAGGDGVAGEAGAEEALDQKQPK